MAPSPAQTTVFRNLVRGHKGRPNSFYTKSPFCPIPFPFAPTLAQQRIVVKTKRKPVRKRCTSRLFDPVVLAEYVPPVEVPVDDSTTELTPEPVESLSSSVHAKGTLTMTPHSPGTSSIIPDLGS